ncbi:threonine synthase [Flavobacterium sp. '19STA2R22 D10 B1']|uniref:threonine synthase n=1 Tax=Flavobacterium aerium TaxID=3037261 RepID=UPI00278BF869|nr:threonine synthase [Flavobacterium sp. '19STA2R22 D10 B1']
MKYYSINQSVEKIGFEQAVIQGIAVDKGLFFPEEIPALSSEFIKNIEQYSPTEIALEVIKPFVGGEIPEFELKQIIKETLSFDFPLVEVQKDIFALELFHGPTLAFKDVGARFMSRCLRYFNKNKTEQKITVLVATSGDTGSAVANGFLGVEGVNVVILYPCDKVSDIQEKQLTTLGQNITALEVKGSFDDCQNMVKKAFLDDSLKTINLTSANSINVARWLPQMFYYFFAYKELKSKGKPIVVSVPSGNFGNICAGLMAKKMGLPISHFIASTNANDTIPRYLIDGEYSPLYSKPTLSNAMDVSDPSNFVRILEIYKQDMDALKIDLSAFAFDDLATKKAMRFLCHQWSYIADPHGAVGYLGLQHFLKNKTDFLGVFLETAHPVKFLNTVEETLDIKLDIPSDIEFIMKKNKISIVINSYSELNTFLLQSE